MLLSFWYFNIKNLQDFIKIYRAVIKDIFLYMFEFWFRFDAFDIFWFEVLNFFELILA